MSCDSHYDFSIDQHSLRIIESDGISTAPLVVDSIQIFAGQRYSFILEAKQKVDNYWIRALPNIGPVGFDGGVNSAILRYVGAKKVEPATPLVAPRNPLIEANLHTLHHQGVPGRPEIGGVDVPIVFTLGLKLQPFAFTVNGVSFVSPTIPMLLQILSGAKAAQDLLPSGSVYPLPRNKVVEVSFIGADVPGGPVS
jgi:iron transport multicopper oxidase